MDSCVFTFKYFIITGTCVVYIMLLMCIWCLESLQNVLWIESYDLFCFASGEDYKSYVEKYSAVREDFQKKMLISCEVCLVWKLFLCELLYEI